VICRHRHGSESGSTCSGINGVAEKVEEQKTCSINHIYSKKLPLTLSCNCVKITPPKVDSFSHPDRNPGFQVSPRLPFYRSSAGVLAQAMGLRIEALHPGFKRRDLLTPCYKNHRGHPLFFLYAGI